MNTDLPLNRGAELLRAAGSISEIAEALGVSPRVVSTWRAGKIPGDENQSALQAAFEIPRRAWREPVAATEPARRAPERRLDIPERCPWLTFGHPLAWITARRLALADAGAGDTAAEAAEAELQALRARHPALVGACENAELQLGLALAAAAAPGDECAAAFLRFHRSEGASL